MRFTKLDYCQYLLSSQINYTLTNLAEHLETVSHDQINRYLRREKLTTKKLMQYIDKQGKYYYCPLKKNRLVDDTEEVEDYKPISSLDWSQTELEHGKIIKVKAFPKDKKVKLFRVIISTDKTEYVATNDLDNDSTDAVLSCVQHSLED